MSPQGRVPGPMAGLKAQDFRVQDPELSLPCLRPPRHKPQPASVPGRKTWEGKGTRLPHSVLELENPVREQGPPSPGEQEVGGKATSGHRTIYGTGAPPPHKCGQPRSWILTRQITAAPWRQAGRGNLVSLNPHNCPFHR